MTRGKQRVSAQSEETDKISVECQDDQFGFNGLVVYGDESFALRRCTPFQTGSNHGVRVPRVPRPNNTAAGQVQDQITSTTALTTNTDGGDTLIFTDGLSPGFMASVGMGATGHELKKDEELYKNETHVYAKGGRKKTKK